MRLFSFELAVVAALTASMYVSRALATTSNKRCNAIGNYCDEDSDCCSDTCQWDTACTHKTCISDDGNVEQLMRAYTDC
ncbi:uncharacterized protein EDB93DRAFT_872368 [Suillus bovinus]|uniref:uncharacterized protein n=1 Tax=Suillus bovinus TaxID=48563 RepID=UPI001B878878|nr:uncharacterized protein EDB93DRAFT_872368 [Suillus bovinus]KAG2156860.1 hypothetical protein EDB93DRAFT_872368 [Suillus bovinus]